MWQAGNYAYVIDRYGGLRIFDVADTANPTASGFTTSWHYPMMWQLPGITPMSPIRLPA
jgi:hypothetical protein